jgi:hypothetical protein
MEEEAEKLWQCMNQRCAAVLRENELLRKELHGMKVDLCPRCGDRVVQVAGAGSAESFFGSLGRAFLYSFRGAGIYILIAGSVLLGLLKLAAGVLLIFGVLILILAYGYLAAYQFDIVLTTANGEDAPPGFPDFSEFWEDILRPFLLLAGTAVFSLLPAALFFIARGLYAREVGGWEWAVFGGLCLAGAFYFPMAFLSVIMFNEIKALNPLVVVPAIVRVIGPYLVVFALLAAVAIGEALLRGWIGGVMPRFGAYFVAQVLALYGTMVHMRMLGILYRTHTRELGWF